MSDDHKAGLAEGRTQGRAVRLYLEALESSKPKRGRKRTPESIERRIAAIAQALPGADPIQKLGLVQEKIDLEAELESLGPEADLSDLEDAFVESAATYSARKRISYTAWRAVGVPAAVLKRSGITRSA
jgi:hypothetical protein